MTAAGKVTPISAKVTIEDVDGKATLEFENESLKAIAAFVDKIAWEADRLGCTLRDVVRLGGRRIVEDLFEYGSPLEIMHVMVREK